MIDGISNRPPYFYQKDIIVWIHVAHKPLQSGTVVVYLQLRPWGDSDFERIGTMLATKAKTAASLWYLGVSMAMGVPQKRWMVYFMENPWKQMDNFGGTSISGNPHLET